MKNLEVKIFMEVTHSYLERIVNNFLAEKGKKIIVKDIKYAFNEDKYSAMIIYEDNSSAIDDIL